MRAKNSRQQIAEDIASFECDPLGWVLYAFPWGEPGTELEHRQLEDWQRTGLEQLGRFLKDHHFRKENEFDLPAFRKAVASGHGIGKSTFMAWITLFFMSTRKFCRGVVTANTGQQISTKTWPELSKWWHLSINKDWFDMSATKFWCKLIPGQEENWKFDAVTWSTENTEAFAGLHNQNGSIILFDEASAIDDKIWEVAEGVLVDPLVVWFAFGNPTQNIGRFYECFGLHRDVWINTHIDSRSCKMNAQKQSEYANWAKLYGEDSDFFRVRVKGQFPSVGEKQWISTALVEGAQQREQVPDPGAPLVMGVDPARYGKDKLVIRFRKGRDARSIPAVKLRGVDNVTAANHIVDLMLKYKPDAVNIDSGGGAGIIDLLRAWGYKVNEINFGIRLGDGPYANTRTRLWGEMRDWLALGCIDGDPELRTDLVGPQYQYAGTEGDQWQLETKEQMAKRGVASPDDADALACTFAVKVARRDSRTSRHHGKARQARDVDYSVLG